MSKTPEGLAVRTQKRYGWRADSPDMRDYLLAVEPVKTLPRSVSLRSKMPPVYDQGQLGSCTANSVGAILEFNEVLLRYPKGDKVPAALLRQALAFAELGDKVDARLVLQKLVSEHGDSPEAEKGRQKLAELSS